MEKGKAVKWCTVVDVAALSKEGLILRRPLENPYRVLSRITTFVYQLSSAVG